MGLIIIDKPILWHSSRVPGEYNWDKMTPEQIKLIRTRFHDVLLSLIPLSPPSLADPAKLSGIRPT
jgi:hypothetical protein